MRVFLAGAAGVIGRRLVPLLLAAGHEVTGTARAPERAQAIAAAGAGAAGSVATPIAGGGGSVATRPVVRSAHENIGRNDPCWCGSGKKFKKCHGA